MTNKLIIPLPFEAPWTANREGMIKAESGDRLGYTRYDSVGDLARMQMVSRFWAASPDLANAVVNLIATADAALTALYRGRDVTDLAAFYKAAKSDAFEALERLQDPVIDPRRAINAPITEVVEQLKRGAA